ncbi:hypothetical protein QE152_g37518 [Popillia japonica]|uniref:Uncharacterized protein n=1 Tax=Popillia japonica TaxID=7064 RepID=A0AAW1IA10_POPJA
MLRDLPDDEDFLESVNIVMHPRQPKVYRRRTNEFNKWSDEEFRNRFRLSKPVVEYVTDEIADEISSQSNRESGSNGGSFCSSSLIDVEPPSEEAVQDNVDPDHHGNVENINGGNGDVHEMHITNHFQQLCTRIYIMMHKFVPEMLLSDALGYGRGDFPFYYWAYL